MAHFVLLLHEEQAMQTGMYVQAEKNLQTAKALHNELSQASQSSVFLLGAGDGMVKFWDMRKTDKPSWQLSAPSPGAVQPVLTPTPKIRSKVANAPPTINFASQAGSLHSKHMHLQLQPAGREACLFQV